MLVAAPEDELEPHAASRVPTEPAATPVSAERRRNDRRSNPGLFGLVPLKIVESLYRLKCIVGL